MSNRDVLQDIAATLGYQLELGERGPFIARLDVVPADTGALTRKHFLIIDSRIPVTSGRVAAYIAFTLPDIHGMSDLFVRGPISIIEVNNRGECFEAPVADLRQALRPVLVADPANAIAALHYTLDDALVYARELRLSCGDNAARMAIDNLAAAGLIHWPTVREDILSTLIREENLHISPDYPYDFATEVDRLLTEDIVNVTPHKQLLMTIIEVFMSE